jgi:hypothetical protein
MENGAEAAGILRHACILQASRQLVRLKLDGALDQIVHHQAGLQGGQHYQYRPDRKSRGKITVGKKSLEEIQHPDSYAVGF